jgi:transposase
MLKIAARLDCHPDSVSGRRRRFCAERIEGLQDRPRAGRPRRFPPEQLAEVVAVACELPARHGRPLGRFSRTELHRLVIEEGVTDASATTIWRWLHGRSLKPWQQRSWIFPRDPEFQPKAGRVLELYARRFEGRLLHPGEYVICADEKSQLQALARRHETVAPAPGRPHRSSSSTAGAARWPIWPPGMSTTPGSSATARPRPGSSRSAGWWSRS